MNLGKYVDVKRYVTTISINIVAALIDLMRTYPIAEISSWLIFHIIGSLGVRLNLMGLGYTVSSAHIKIALLSLGDLSMKPKIFSFKIFHVHICFIFLFYERDFMIWYHNFHFN